ncbi:hypothetical protein [Rhizobium sp. LEGMi135b]
MFKFLRKKKPLVVTATLNARLQPVDRADIEDAFEEALTKRGYGLRVVGGGTLMAPNGEISECDIQIELDDPSDKTIAIVIGTLEAMLAPKGSRLQVPDRDQPIMFGAQDGLALYLNGTDLPDDVYADCDINHVFDECGRLLEGVGRVSSYWEGPSETALYMYGTGFGIMRERLAPFLETYPLCQQCRTEQIA